MNIVLLTIDSLRADHLGCYGYGKATSPCIDALAAKSVVFDRAFSTGIPTMPSFTTLLTGLHPYRHGITAHSSEQRLGPDVEMLPQLAKQAGMVTIGIDNLVVQGSGRGSWFARGFDYYSGFLYKPFSNQSEQLTDRALTFIDDFRDRPFFLFMHLWDPHTPYGPPAPYDTMHYAPGPDTAERLAAATSIAPEYYEAFLGDMNLKQPNDYDYVVAQYDGEISYVDAQIGRIVDRLHAHGLWEDTVVVLMSDHGECFGEGGLHFDHHGLYDAVIRIALTWHAPGVAPGRTDVMASTSDILPTLCDLCDLPLPAQEPTGFSLAPALSGDQTPLRDHVAAVESSRQASICWRTDKWKLVLPITRDARGEPLSGIYGEERDPAPQLFDLLNDPAETTNVAEAHPAICQALLLQLTEWRTAEVARRGGDDPLVENGLSLDYADFMARLTSRKLRG